MADVKLVWVTPEAEKHILYMARVSNPDNQNSENTKLIAYLIRAHHWSPFEMVNMCAEITTSRAISAQLIRHRSFSFQEFSQRYAKVAETETYDARRQDPKNRQHSIDDMDEPTQTWFLNAQWNVYQHSTQLYSEALDRGIAKECARFLLPMASTTKLYMSGTARSWIHYIQLRTDESSAQKEHRDIARSIQELFRQSFPIVSKALQWME